jgi:transposase
MEIKIEDIQRLDHFGIVAGVIKDLGIAELVNEMIGTDTQEILRTGDVVAGLVINGLGFASRPLMLAPQFFESKAIDLLIKPGITPEHFNRHKIGRTLDAISDFGCEKLFNHLALSACKTEGIDTRFGHADTTSYELHGNYEELDETGNPIEQRIAITHGYSKANRPDLKQVVQELITTQDGGIPLITKTLSGNASDTIILRERAKALMDEFSKSSSRCFVADCKLYAEDTAPMLNKINFITRVPSILKNEQVCVEKALNQDDAWITISDNYKYQEFQAEQFNINDQRWIVLFSMQARSRAQKTVEKDVAKEKERIEKEISAMQKKPFGCEADAFKTLNALSKKWRYHTVTEHKVIETKNYKERGRPTDKTPFDLGYTINITYAFSKEKFDQTLNQRSCFVLATNVNKKNFDASEVLKNYKEQDHTEKGFAFLKKPEFFTSSLNLEKPGRIEAILMIMVLSLLVYSVAQRRLRKQLDERNQTVPDQLKKPIKNPTMRWIFQLFEGINFVKGTAINGTKTAFVYGMNPLRLQIVSLLGQNVLKIYQTSLGAG